MKYESDAIKRTEELEESRKKLTALIQEAEEKSGNSLAKCESLVKTKVRLTNEMEDLSVNLERANTAINGLEKKQRHFDQEISAWKQKVEELQSEVDLAQRDSRDHQTEMYKVRNSFEESVEAWEVTKRDNANLAEEIKDLQEQLSVGGRSVNEMNKAKKRAELSTEELRVALEEAVGAHELEE